MFERIEYTVERIDGDYAYLKNDAEPNAIVHNSDSSKKGMI